MGNKDYEQKKRECWKELIGTDGIPTERLRACLDFAFDRAYALGKQFGNSEQVDVAKAAKKFADEIRIPASIPGVMVPFINGLAHDAYLQGAQDFLGKQESKQESKQETVLSGWVARDKSGTVCLYNECPERYNAPINEWVADNPLQYYRIPDELFPDLTWESEPEEVEIVIKRKKNG